MKALLAGLFVLATVTNADKPKLITRVFPVIQSLNLSTGCSLVILTAEIKGIENERWYCPRVEWTMSNGTEAFVESDCPPFEERYECSPKRGAECALDWHTENDGSKIIDNNPCECTIPGYPRRWRRPYCAGPDRGGNGQIAVVRLTKGKDVIAREEIRFYVK